VSKALQKILPFILLALSFSSYAQLSVGARAGYGAYGIYFEPDLNKYQVPYLLYNTGLMFVYNNENNAGVQFEINYAQKGWQEQDTSVIGSNFTRRIDYLEIPFYSHWEIGFGKVRPMLILGPYLAFKLGETTDSTNFSHLWNEKNPYNHYEQEIRPLDFGIKIIVGIKYNITKRLGIFIDARYDFQLAGGSNIFIDRPNEINASRLKELSGSFGILWNIKTQKKKIVKEGYEPTKDFMEEE